MKNLNKISYRIMLVFCVSCIILFSSACEEELPSAGSLPDKTPPAAFFTFSQSDVNYLDVTFANQSTSATIFFWEFGDGNTSTDEEPSNEYAAEGSYTVSLTATDANGLDSTYSEVIELVEPDIEFMPVILEAGFEDGSDGADSCGDGNEDGRDCWRNSDLGGVIQITQSPVHEGAQAAKLPTSNDRIGYQLVTVEADTDYILSFYYTMKTSPAGSLTVRVLNGPVNDPNDIAGATIVSGTYSDQTDDSAYILESLTFNSGSSTQIAIYFDNVDVESRLDSFTLVEN